MQSHIFTISDGRSVIFTYTAFQRCAQEKLFLKYAANLQENTHAKVQFK